MTIYIKKNDEEAVKNFLKKLEADRRKRELEAIHAYAIERLNYVLKKCLRDEECQEAIWQARKPYLEKYKKEFDELYQKYSEES